MYDGHHGENFECFYNGGENGVKPHGCTISQCLLDAAVRLRAMTFVSTYQRVLHVANSAILLSCFIGKSVEETGAADWRVGNSARCGCLRMICLACKSFCMES